MGSINIRIEGVFKACAYRQLERLRVNPSEFMREALQYVAEQGKLAV